jgi:hypothetical protein
MMETTNTRIQVPFKQPDLDAIRAIAADIGVGVATVIRMLALASLKQRMGAAAKAAVLDVA